MESGIRVEIIIFPAGVVGNGSETRTHQFLSFPISNPIFPGLKQHSVVFPSLVQIGTSSLDLPKVYKFLKQRNLMGKVIQIEIPEEIITGIKIPEKDLEKIMKIELAIARYQKGYLSFGQARKITGLSKIEFINELAERKVERHYTEEDLRDDVEFRRM